MYLKEEKLGYGQMWQSFLIGLLILFILLGLGWISSKVFDVIMISLFFGTLIFAKTVRLWSFIIPLGIYALVRRDEIEKILQFVIFFGIPVLYIFFNRKKSKQTK